jgi:hypothetical protein
LLKWDTPITAASSHDARLPKTDRCGFASRDEQSRLGCTYARASVIIAKGMQRQLRNSRAGSWRSWCGKRAVSYRPSGRDAVGVELRAKAYGALNWVPHPPRLLLARGVGQRSFPLQIVIPTGGAPLLRTGVEGPAVCSQRHSFFFATNRRSLHSASADPQKRRVEKASGRSGRDDNLYFECASCPRL